MKGRKIKLKETQTQKKDKLKSCPKKAGRTKTERKREKMALSLLIRSVLYTLYISDFKGGGIFGMWFFPFPTNLDFLPDVYITGASLGQKLRTVSLTGPFKVLQWVSALLRPQHCVTGWQIDKIKTQKQLLNFQCSHEHAVISYHTHVFTHSPHLLIYQTYTHHCYTLHKTI